MTDTTFKIDIDTVVTLVRVNQRKWELRDSEGAVIHTGKTRKSALLYIDRLVSAAKSMAARKAKSESKLEGAKKPSNKLAANGVKSAKGAKAAAKPTSKDTKAAKSKSAAKAISKPKAATVKTDKNINHFTFGSKIDAETVVRYAGEIWGDVLTLSNVEFVDSHYWKGTVTNEAGDFIDNTKLDYLINYCRVPTALKSDAVIAQQEKAIAAAAK